jgi:hypothetical protein
MRPLISKHEKKKFNEIIVETIICCFIYKLVKVQIKQQIISHWETHGG